jgi:hypothetical protein
MVIRLPDPVVLHLACKLEQQLFYIEMQGTTPITKHIFILSGMQKTP